MAGLEGTLKPTQFQPPAAGGIASHQVKMLKQEREGNVGFNKTFKVFLLYVREGEEKKKETSETPFGIICSTCQILK